MKASENKSAPKESKPRKSHTKLMANLLTTFVTVVCFGLIYIEWHFAALIGVKIGPPGPAPLWLTGLAGNAILLAGSLVAISITMLTHAYIWEPINKVILKALKKHD